MNPNLALSEQGEQVFSELRQYSGERAAKPIFTADEFLTYFVCEQIAALRSEITSLKHRVWELENGEVLK